MPLWLAVVVATLVFAGAAAWAGRRLLDTGVGWPRALVTSAVVFVVSLPLVAWALTQAHVIAADGRAIAAAPVVVAFAALIVGWQFAIVVIVLVTLEFLWPSHRMRGPVTAVRELFRGRDRARRYAQIVAIASRHGLGLYQSHRRGDDDLPAALVSALNEAGVTFVKLGQVLSTREDVLPRELVEALATLQMDSTPVPWAEVEASIRAELGRPLDEVFATIDEAPLAAASVAQVHAATLVTGEDVVVKIQRASARAQVTTDLDILERLAMDAERRTDWARGYGAVALVDEFARALSRELDYRVEVDAAEMLRSAVARSQAQRVTVPATVTALCTSRMIVQERAHGVPFGKLTGAEVDAETARAIADDVLDAVFEQIAVRGVFHADLHPGNLILEDDGTVALIDFGSVGILESSMRRLLVPMLVAISNDDDISATDLVLILCDASPEQVDQAALQRDVGAILTRVQNEPAGAEVFREFLDTLRRHRLALPPQLLLVFRTLASLEGSLRRLAPGYDMVGRALERAPHYARRMISPRRAALALQTQASLAVEQLRRAPRRLENLARALEEGTLSVRVKTFQSPAERGFVEGLLGWLTTTIVGVALVATGLSLAVSTGGPELTSGVSAFAYLGSAVGLGGMLLVVRSLRSALRRRTGR